MNVKEEEKFDPAKHRLEYKRFGGSNFNAMHSMYVNPLIYHQPVPVKQEIGEDCAVKEERYRALRQVQWNASGYKAHDSVPNPFEAPFGSSTMSNNNLYAQNDAMETKPDIMTFNMLSSLENGVKDLVDTSKSVCDALCVELKANKLKCNEDKSLFQAKISELTVQLNAITLDRDLAHLEVTNTLKQIEVMEAQFQAKQSKTLWDYQEKTEKEHDRVLADLRVQHIIELENEKELFAAEIESLKMEHSKAIAAIERNTQVAIEAKNNVKAELENKYKNIIAGIMSTVESERAQFIEQSKRKMMCACCGILLQENIVCSERCAQWW